MKTGHRRLRVCCANILVRDPFAADTAHYVTKQGQILLGYAKEQRNVVAVMRLDAVNKTFRPMHIPGVGLAK